MFFLSGQRGPAKRKVSPMLDRQQYAQILADISDARLGQEILNTVDALGQVENFLSENPDAPDYDEALDFYLTGQEAFTMAMDEMLVRAEITAGGDADEWTWED